MSSQVASEFTTRQEKCTDIADSNYSVNIFGRVYPVSENDAQKYVETMHKVGNSTFTPGSTVRILNWIDDHVYGEGELEIFLLGAYKILNVLVAVTSLVVFINGIFNNDFNIAAFIVFLVSASLLLPDISSIKYLMLTKKKVSISNSPGYAIPEHDGCGYYFNHRKFVNVGNTIMDSLGIDDENVYDKRQELFYTLDVFRDYASSGEETYSECLKVVKKKDEALSKAVEDYQSSKNKEKDFMDKENAKIVKSMFNDMN